MQTVIQINSMPDHLHILVGMAPNIAFSDLVRDIKANSSKFINTKRWIVGRFEWQAGFTAFYGISIALVVRSLDPNLRAAVR